MSDNPYQDLSGDGWEELAPGVKLAHSVPLQAHGQLTVRHAHAGVARLIARAIMLPPEGESVPTELEVRPEFRGVRWIRSFGTMKAESVQTFANGYFTEQAGPFRMTMRIDPHGDSAVHVQVGTRIFGLPVPRFCGPTVSGAVGPGPDDRSWHLAIAIAHDWFGMICTYEGVMHAE